MIFLKKINEKCKVEKNFLNSERKLKCIDIGAVKKKTNKEKEVNIQMNENGQIPGTDEERYLYYKFKDKRHKDLTK